MRHDVRLTRIVLLVAAFVVGTVAVVTVRDFVSFVFPVCPGALEKLSHVAYPPSVAATPPLVEVSLDGTSPTSGGVAFKLAYDGSGALASARGVRNLRIVRVVDESRSAPRTANEAEGSAGWREPPCECGAVALGNGSLLLPSETFRDHVDPDLVTLYRDRAGVYFVLPSRIGNEDLPGLRAERDPAGARDAALASAVASFRVTAEPMRRVQPARIFATRHVPAAVALVAAIALVVALLRASRVRAYAVHMHRWTEALLTAEGRIESDSGGTLAVLARPRSRYLRPGPVLVAEAVDLGAPGVYREMPLVADDTVVEGTHRRWGAATAMSLRDARVLAIVATTCSALAWLARTLG